MTLLGMTFKLSKPVFTSKSTEKFLIAPSVHQNLSLKIISCNLSETFIPKHQDDKRSYIHRAFYQRGQKLSAKAQLM